MRTWPTPTSRGDDNLHPPEGPAPAAGQRPGHGAGGTRPHDLQPPTTIRRARVTAS